MATTDPLYRPKSIPQVTCSAFVGSMVGEFAMTYSKNRMVIDSTGGKDPRVARVDVS